MKNFYQSINNERLIELANDAIINKRDGDDVKKIINELNNRGIFPDPIIELEGMFIPFSNSKYKVQDDLGSDIYHAYLAPKNEAMPIIEVAEENCPSFYVY